MKIQRIPRGFLQLINSLSAGAAPQELGDVVSCTIDIEKYLAYSAAQQFSSGLGGSLDPIPSITVPQTQWWLLQAATVELSPTVAEATVDYQFMMRGPTGSPATERFCLASRYQDRTGAAGQAANDRLTYQPAGGLQLIPPGTVFEARRNLLWVPAGNIALTLQLIAGVLG